MRFFITASLVCSLFAVSGCEPKAAPKKDDHASHDHAGHDHSHGEKEKVTYETPTAELKAILGKAIAAVGAVADASEKGNVDDAHDELHDVGHYLESLPKLAQAASLGETQTDALTQVSKSLFEKMNLIDESLHHGDGDFKYDTIKDDVRKDLDQLKAIADNVGK